MRGCGPYREDPMSGYAGVEMGWREFGKRKTGIHFLDREKNLALEKKGDLSMQAWLKEEYGAREKGYAKKGWEVLDEDRQVSLGSSMVKGGKLAKVGSFSEKSPCQLWKCSGEELPLWISRKKNA